jgi:hypothetical protein
MLTPEAQLAPLPYPSKVRLMPPPWGPKCHASNLLLKITRLAPSHPSADQGGCDGPLV